MGFCSICGNWVDEGDICSHCGSSGGSYEKDEDGPNIAESFYQDGLLRSKSGDHLSAIKYYKKSFLLMWLDDDKCEMLSLIADEYEAMGDYFCAEEYWNRCCAIAERRKRLYVKYISKKGDFFHRTGRYIKAIDAYEKALKTLENKKIYQSDLTYYARVVHFIIDSYDKLGDDYWHETYHNILKDGIDRFIGPVEGGDKIAAHYLSRTAWEIYENDRLIGEALILFDSAIEIHPDCPAYYYNRKAIILDYDFQYEEALKYYDMALSKDSSNKTFLKNRAECEAECIKSKLEAKVIVGNIEPSHLDLINKALKILPDDYDNAPFLKVKSEILKLLGDPVKARICYCIAYKKYDEVDTAEKQLKKLKHLQDYISITGTQHYQNFAPFKEGTIVDLIRELDNPHDCNAIRVELNGETVGYVANSKYTLIKEVKSATEIKDTRSTQAEVQFILFGEWVIAKLI